MSCANNFWNRSVWPCTITHRPTMCSPPRETYPRPATGNVSIYVAILPYVEQGNLLNRSKRRPRPGPCHSAADKILIAVGSQCSGGGGRRRTAAAPYLPFSDNELRI